MISELLVWVFEYVLRYLSQKIAANVNESKKNTLKLYLEPRVVNPILRKLQFMKLLRVGMQDGYDRLGLLSTLSAVFDV